jgi:hypothetical protein
MLFQNINKIKIPEFNEERECGKNHLKIPNTNY